MKKADQLVSTHWLNEHLSNDNIVLLDASTVFDTEKTIRGAQHFDIKNTFSNTKSPFPNTFPSVAQFEEESRRLGITAQSHLVIFDDKGIFNSPRVWWMYRSMEHPNVSVLNGGLPEWISQGYELGTASLEKRIKGDFKAHFQPNAVKKYEDIVKNLSSSEYLVIDARSKGRFEGTSPEPRKHIKSGHIKNSINLPYTELLDQGKFKPKKALKAIFINLNIADRPIIFSCGSGISACIILLGFDLISEQVTSVYDGSWTEWAEKEGLYQKERFTPKTDIYKD